jgi:hypothetical protein
LLENDEIELFHGEEKNVFQIEVLGDEMVDIDEMFICKQMLI